MLRCILSIFGHNVNNPLHVSHVWTGSLMMRKEWFKSVSVSPILTRGWFVLHLLFLLKSHFLMGDFIIFNLFVSSTLFQLFCYASFVFSLIVLCVSEDLVRFIYMECWHQCYVSDLSLFNCCETIIVFVCARRFVYVYGTL